MSRTWRELAEEWKIEAKKGDKRIAELEEALHEIYGRACQATECEDDHDLRRFVAEIRLIALTGKALEGRG